MIFKPFCMLQDAKGCIIMFDVTNKNSFLNVAKWKDDLDSKCLLPNGSSVPCLLLANKVRSINFKAGYDTSLQKNG